MNKKIKLAIPKGKLYDEVINYKDRGNLVGEIADLTYFIMVLMAKKNISITDIKNELWRRRK